MDGRTPNIDSLVLDIRLFGAPQAFAGGAPWRLNAPPKSIVLLAILLARDGGANRAWLAATLWPDESDSGARTNLRRHLHRLAQTLPLAPQPWILTEGSDVRWNAANGASADVRTFVNAIDDGICRADVLPLYSGEFLQGYDDEWTLVQRERYRTLFLDSAYAAAVAARQQRRFADASALVDRMLAVDEWREDAVRLAMSARYEAGDRASALSTFSAFAARLRREMNVDPMAETVALQNAILANDPLASQLSAANEATSDRRSWQLPFAGRASQLFDLRRAWHRAARGHGNAVFVAGEAGIGKSRLVSEFATEVEAQGGRVLFGVTSQPETQPYQAVVDALRRALPLLTECDVKLVWLAVLRSVLPEVSAMLPALGDPPPLAHDKARARLFESMARCFEALARSRPLLIVLEDLHWAHDGGVDALLTIAKRVAALPILLVVTYRSQDVDTHSALREAHRSLQRDRRAISIALAPLNETAIASILAGSPAVPDASGDLAATMLRYSNGNPLFIALLIQGIRETHTVPNESSAVASLRGAILARLDHLEPLPRAIAEVAATIGSPFTGEMVGAVGGWRDDEVLDGIASLAERAFVREAGGGAVDYTFAHVLLENVVYEASGEEARRTRHHRIARLLDRGEAGVRLERVALHWERAGVSERATRSYLAAARAAATVFARDAVQDYARRAHDLAAGDGERFEALTLIAGAYHGSAHVAELDRCVSAMEELAERLTDDERYIAAEMREKHAAQMADRTVQGEAIEQMLGIARRLGDAHRLAGALDLSGARYIMLGKAGAARETLESALLSARLARDPLLTTRIHGHLAQVLSLGGDTEGASAMLAAASARDPAQNDAMRALFLNVEASIAINTDDPERGDRVAAGMFELAEKIGDVDLEARAYLTLATVATYRRSATDARRAYHRAIELADLSGDRHLLGSALSNHAAAEVDVGQLALAKTLAERGLAIAQEVSYALGEAFANGILAEIARDEGRLVEAQAHLERAFALAADTTNPRLLANLQVARASINMRLGAAAASAAEFHAGIATRVATGAPVKSLLDDYCEVVEAALIGNDRELLQWGASELAPLASELPRHTRHPARIASALARAAAASGDEAGVQRWIEQGRRALDERLALFSELADRDAYLAKPFVAALMPAP
jgi:predicted ATPase/DNA-binding SARP family transcriptional activator